MGARRGQITVYMIIGLIALVGVSVFLYMRTVKVEAPITYLPTLEDIPFEAEPIREYITSCLRKVAEEGLITIGDRGGYIDLEHMGASYNPISATESAVIQFAPGSGLLVPYWWHMDSPNNCDETLSCTFKAKWPHLYRVEGDPSIESQLDEYVNENLELCLHDFVDFSEAGFAIAEEGDVDTRTIVTQDTVAFEMKYPVVAQKGGVTYHINDYFVDIPVNLKDIYELAAELAVFQVEKAYLDNYMKYVLAAFRGVDENALPPIAGTGIDFSGGVTWRLSEVRQKVSQIIASYMPFLRVANTSNYAYIDIFQGSQYEDAMLSLHNVMNYVVPWGDESRDYSDLEVHFSYLDWGDMARMYFNIDQCEGETCGPGSISGAGSVFSFALQRYISNYDISAPILINIVNPDALNERGYTFKYFMEANIRNNVAVSKGLRNFSIPAAHFTGETMVCDENKRNSPEFTMELIDALEGLPVEDAVVNFRCGSETCGIGDTDENGKLTANYPVCIGGILEIAKTGYIGYSVIFNTNHNYAFEERLLIQPYRYKDIEVRKLELRKNCVSGIFAFDCTWDLFNDTLTAVVGGEKGSPMTRHEEAIVTLTKHRDADGRDHMVAADYVGDRALEDSSKDVQIVPGIYDVEITVINRQEFRIPEAESCEEDPGLFQDPECTTIDAIAFGRTRPFNSGGASITGVPITTTDLDPNDIIVFYVITVELDNVAESLREHIDVEQVMATTTTYSSIYRNLLLPDYKKKDAAIDRGGIFVI